MHVRERESWRDQYNDRQTERESEREGMDGWRQGVASHLLKINYSGWTMIKGASCSVKWSEIETTVQTGLWPLLQSCHCFVFLTCLWFLVFHLFKMSLFQWKLHFRHDLLENQKTKVKKNLSVLFISDTVNYGIALNLLPPPWTVGNADYKCKMV